MQNGNIAVYDDSAPEYQPEYMRTHTVVDIDKFKEVLKLALASLVRNKFLRDE